MLQNQKRLHSSKTIMFQYIFLLCFFEKSQSVEMFDLGSIIEGVLGRTVQKHGSINAQSCNIILSGMNSNVANQMVYKVSSSESMLFLKFGSCFTFFRPNIWLQKWGL